MIRFLTILTILAFSASQGFATPVNLVVTGGVMTTEVSNALLPTPDAEDPVVPSMPLSSGSSAVFGSSSGSATYEFTNGGGVASFDIRPITQHVDLFQSPENVNQTQASGEIDFQLNEALSYNVTGDYSGNSTSNTDFISSWALRDEDNSIFVFREREVSVAAASHVVNESDDGTEPTAFVLIGSPTGILPPGNYSFEYTFFLVDGNFIASTADTTGFANLTLTRVIPEPASAVLMLLALCAVHLTSSNCGRR